MGFELMMDHESPNALFTILQTRYPTGNKIIYSLALMATYNITSKLGLNRTLINKPH